MKLFYSPGACSLAPHIALREAGLAFSLEKVDTSKHLTTTGTDYYSVNPKGQVPVLELGDGARLTEGPVIAQYIGDQAAKTGLMPPAGSMARYRVMEWQNYITSELHKSFTPLFNPEFDATAKSLHAKLLLKKYAWVDAQLARSKYLTGDTFTVADAYLFTVRAGPSMWVWIFRICRTCSVSWQTLKPGLRCVTPCGPRVYWPDAPS